MHRTAAFLLALTVAAACAPPSRQAPQSEAQAAADSPAPRASAWLQHDLTRPFPPRVEPAPSRLPAPVPTDATVLIPADGSSLAAWESADGSTARWESTNGAVVIAPGTGPIQTRASFGDVQLHLEWMAADEPERTSQDRSNSGVFFIDGRYEVQILDTYENRTYADGAAAAIYGQYPPLANALRPPDQWQAYDIFFRGPRFDEDGAVGEPARLTVLQNGILVQNNELLAGMTIWLQSQPYEVHPHKGKIQLQDHGSPVRFRNLWVRETPERAEPPDGYASEPVAKISDADLARLVGTYERGGPNDVFIIERSDGGLALSMPWRKGSLPMIPLSADSFRLENTAGRLTFELPETGDATALTFEMGGGVYPATRATD